MKSNWTSYSAIPFSYKDKKGKKNSVVVAKGEEGERRRDRMLGVSRYKLLHLEWVNNMEQIF